MRNYLGDLVAINGLPILACLAVSGVLVYLGLHVVRRKVIFVDLALAQIAAFGVMWAILMGYDHEHDTVAVTLYSLAFTVAGAGLFAITRPKKERVPHEAIIGIIYVTATAAGLMLADRFALGTEAMKELIAGRVALITPDDLWELLAFCAVVALFHLLLYRKFEAASADPEHAEAVGLNLRLWDFLFYVSFGVLITQAVKVLGVLPVFAYLVIPAVTALLLFDSIRNRLIFGWLFAGIISVVGLEAARAGGLDPGPTIVCIFAGSLMFVGVGLYLRNRRFAPRALSSVAIVAAFTVALLGGSYALRKPVATDELGHALHLAATDEAGPNRQALDSFRSFPEQQEQWLPLVMDMLRHPDLVVRADAATLLGEVKAEQAIPPLSLLLNVDREPEDEVREAATRALRAMGSPTAVATMVTAAQQEPAPDIAVQMCATAFELGGTAEAVHLRATVEILLSLIADRSAPHGARRDAMELLHTHLGTTLGTAEDVEPTQQWWQTHKDQLVWAPSVKRFGTP